jgi:hypothetical protein
MIKDKDQVIINYREEGNTFFKKEMYKEAIEESIKEY